MIYEELSARELGLPAGDPNVTLRVYARDAVDDHLYADEPGRWGLLLLPGGGYRRRAPRETEPVALKFLEAGVQVFTLSYSVEPYHWPQSFLEVAGALAWLRKNCGRYHVRPDRLAVCGFSAGGHLAGCAANLWGDEVIARELGAAPEQVRPDALILGYPVISAASPGNTASLQRLTGYETLPRELSKLSLETSVTNQNPPAFLWTTWSDQIVPAENTLLYARALWAHGVAAEVHIFQEGPHGMALGDGFTGAPEAVRRRVAGWHGLCVEWLRRLGAGD